VVAGEPLGFRLSSAGLDNQVPDVIYIICMGQLRLEISNEAHAEALRQARLAGLELRQYLREVLEEAIERRRVEQGKTKKS